MKQGLRGSQRVVKLHRVEGESMSSEARVEGEQSTSNDGEEQNLTVKCPRLEDMGTLAAVPLQPCPQTLPSCDHSTFDSLKIARKNGESLVCEIT